MDQPPEVTNIKNESTDSTSSNRLEISTVMQVESIQQESDCLVQSPVYIKTEPQEYENDFPIISGTSYEMYPNYDVKIEMEEPMIKVECECLVNEIMQDPLDVASEIKDEEHVPIDYDNEARIKYEPNEGEKGKNLLETDKNVSHGSRSNHQDQLLVRNDPDCKYKKNVCNECNKTFRWKWQLDNHLLIHTDENPFICSYCKKSFSQKRHLDTHMLIHSGEKPHICNVCKKAFNRKSNLDTHKLIHSGKKPFACNECGKSFTRKQDYLVHKRIHTGVKPYSCNMCNKAFVQKGDLTKHTRTHTGEKPYSCDICNKLFAFKSAFNRHKKIHKN